MSITDNHLWPPYVNIRQAENLEINIVGGDGIYLTDITGKRYINGFSGLSLTCGLGNHEIADAISAQANELAYCSLFRMSNEPATKLAKVLSRHAPGNLNQVVLTASGSEAIEAAIKIARQYFTILGHKKRVILSLDSSYHGNSYAAFSLSGLYRGNEHNLYGPVAPGFEFMPTPRCDIEGENYNIEKSSQLCAQAAEELISSRSDEVAAVVLEPVLAAGGVIAPTAEYFERIIACCKDNNVLVVMDESATGFGRIGARFAIDVLDVKPDILILGKGINGGYLPCGAAIVSDEIFQVYGSGDGHSLTHTVSQAGNPICCSAAIAAINYMERECLYENAGQMGLLMLKQCESKLRSLPLVSDVRSKGLMLAIDLIEPKTLQPLKESKILILYKLLLEDGLIVHTKRNRIHFFPPLIITKQEIVKVVEILYINIKKLIMEKIY